MTEMRSISLGPDMSSSIPPIILAKTPPMVIAVVYRPATVDSRVKRHFILTDAAGFQETIDLMQKPIFSDDAYETLVVEFVTHMFDRDDNF